MRNIVFATLVFIFYIRMFVEIFGFHFEKKRRWIYVFPPAVVFLFSCTFGLQNYYVWYHFGALYALLLFALEVQEDLDFLTKIGYFICTYCTSNILEGTVENFMSEIYRSAPVVQGVLDMLILNVLLFLIIRIGKVRKQVFRIPRKLMLPISLTFLVFALVVSLYIEVLDVVYADVYTVQTGKIVISVSDVLMVSLLYFMIAQINKNMQLQEENWYKDLKASELENLYAHLQENNMQTKKMRHEMLNHMLAIQYGLENQEYVETQDYVKKITGDLTELKKAVINTGDDFLDLLLNYHLRKHIGEDYLHLDVRLQTTEYLEQNKKDMNVLLSNLLDNAVEALEKITNKKKRYLFVQIYATRYGLQVQIENAVEGQENWNVQLENGIRMLSEKQGDHGYGILNVKDILLRYHGMGDLECKGGMCKVNIVVPWQDKAS